MTTIRRGQRGGSVVEIQRLLNTHGFELAVDGVFGPKTEEAVELFQARSGLYEDGIVGPKTRAALAGELFFATVPVSIKTGYEYFRVRSDVAADLRKLDRRLAAVGSGLSSSGGVRSLNARVSPTRSATSLHYLGLAFDLHVGAAMSFPSTDPYIVTRDPDNYRGWRVLARVADDIDRDEWSRVVPGGLAVLADNTVREVEGLFVDLTLELSKIGWSPIRAKRSFFSGRYGGAEWWHFQCEAAIPPNATFGSLLSKVYSPGEYLGTPPARYFDYVWQADFF